MALACGAAVVAVVTFHRSGRPQYLTASVERGDINDLVESSGIVTAVTTVLVGSQVSGTIIRLNADFNSRVNRGDVIAEIDPALFKGALDQASANLEAARAQLQKDRANLAYTKLNYERSSTLLAQGYTSGEAADNSKNVYEQARAQIAVDEATVQQVGAAVAIARTNLEYTMIRSPVDGVVVARNVVVGQTVAASLQAPTIFTIAQDLTKMQVYAKTDESDVGRVRGGTQVTFKVDAFPKEVFHGVVSQLRMNATTIQNVVTYDAIIDFDNTDLKLFPGMTAYLTIPVISVKNVLKIPNTAFRFRLPEARQSDTKAGDAVADALSVRDRAPQDPSVVGSTIVWKIEANNVVPVLIVPGVTDHAYTEVKAVVKGALTLGDVVATGLVRTP